VHLAAVSCWSHAAHPASSSPLANFAGSYHPTLYQERSIAAEINGLQARPRFVVKLERRFLPVKLNMCVDKIDKTCWLERLASR
jgi:hypothetical protein